MTCVIVRFPRIEASTGHMDGVTQDEQSPQGGKTWTEGSHERRMRMMNGLDQATYELTSRVCLWILVTTVV